MFHTPSLKGRLFLSLLYTACLGGVLYKLMPLIGSPLDAGQRFTVWMILVSIGFTVGLSGLFNWLPLVRKRLKWFVRGPFIGLWFGVMVYSMVPDMFQGITSSLSLGPIMDQIVPLLLLGLVGGICDLICTHYAGEGLLIIYAEKTRQKKHTPVGNGAK